ncbi:unnamed protein product [Blepharisma stoltei]|uniref:Uncharacterized protein n=1 Tax=Blepharisma stoltei TaxID=1481888 RepID=A0AAU9K8W4_9CILI|nr:unnamed protein product [Blepharisma stoltei]
MTVFFKNGFFGMKSAKRWFWSFPRVFLKQQKERKKVHIKIYILSKLDKFKQRKLRMGLYNRQHILHNTK